LDAVHQIQRQFPFDFEFNEEFLLFLADHSFSLLFGTFIGNCEKQRVDLELREHTESIWSYLLGKGRPKFVNERWKGFAYSQQQKQQNEDGEEEKKGELPSTNYRPTLFGEEEEDGSIWPNFSIRKIVLWERYFYR